jgi:polysaccharide pyruvyl transferase WcaK-like protein
MNLERDHAFCLVGAAPDTGNLGVSALCFSTLAGLARRAPNARVTVFDNGRGVRRDTLALDGLSFDYQRCGASLSRRVYRRESYYNILASSLVGGAGNPAALALRTSDAVLDISGGDSFADLYGPRVFRSVTLVKRLTLRLGTPLILLPQTYGPYVDPAARQIASDIVRGAHACWARDEHSYDTLKELLGDRYDPARHRCGVDVAFALEQRRPARVLPETLAAWLERREAGPIIGFNVSGLISIDAAARAQRYGLKADYRQVVRKFLRRVLDETDARIVLVPHVLGPAGNTTGEADNGPCDEVARELGAPERVCALPTLTYDQSETKWIIAQTDWFCGTRMHSTIAGLSSGVATAAIAYSGKTLGVFESVAMGDHVADPRTLDTDAVVDRLWWSWETRDAARPVLRDALVGVKQKAAAQMDAIVEIARDARAEGARR